MNQRRISSIISPTRFIALSTLSLGVYIIYWAYGVWRMIKKERKVALNSVSRSIFFPIFSVNFALHVRKMLEEKGFEPHFSPYILGGLFFMISIVGMFPGYWILFNFLLFLPMLPILITLNRYHESYEDDTYIHRIKTSEKVFIIFWICIWMVLIGLTLSVNMMDVLFYSYR